jgi:plastocyanin
MPDLPEDLAALLRQKADDAPATPAPSPSLVRAVRSRQRYRLTAAVGGGVLGVVAVVVATAAVVGPSSRHATPAAPPRTSYPATIVVPPPDDRYESCPKVGAPALVSVSTSGTELKYDRGCYVVAAGLASQLSFTNTTKVAHNVVVAPDGGEPFAKTETVRAGGTSAAGYDTIDLGTLAPGDYTLTCDVHPNMHAQLIAR